MSYSNHTTNYNLPLYVGTDKPTYLGDFNTAMGAIDTQMKANADSASGADTKAGTALTNIGTLSNLTTTAKTNIVSAVNEVKTTADGASTTAGNASTTAGNALIQANSAVTSVQGLEAKFNLTPSNLTVSCPQLTPSQSSLVCAKNSDGSMAKIYGRIRFSSGYNGDCVCTTSDTGLRPDEAITINNCALRISRVNIDGSVVSNVFTLSYTINTNGTVTITIANSSTFSSVDAELLGCVIFVKNFGDQPE